MGIVGKSNRIYLFVVLVVSLMALGLMLHLGAADVQAQGPLLDENFEYGDSPGDLTVVSAGVWTAHSGTTGLVGYQTSSLSFPGYASSGIGGAATFSSSGAEDVNRTFTEQTTGDLYYAALVNLSSATSGGTYFLHFKDSSTGFRGRLWARDSSGNLQFGLTSSSSTGAYSSVNFAYNTTYLVVVKYNVATGDSALYVLDGCSPVEPSSPLLTSTGTATDILAIAIRQGSGGPSGIVDGIRVATDWADAVGPASFCISKSAPAQVSPGQAFTYTLQIANCTGISTTGTIITDAVPANATYVPGSASDGGSLIAGDIVSWTVSGYFTAGLTISRTFQVTAGLVSGADIVNDDYVVAASNWLTPGLGAATTTSIVATDLSITKTGPDDPLWPGDTVTYTINYVLDGTEDALNVIITDTFPTDFVYSEHLAPPALSCTAGADDLICTAAAVDMSGEIILTGTVSATPGRYVLTNTVEITATNDGSTSNNDAEYVNHLVVPIHEIQYVPDPASDDASPFEGQSVWVEGVVTVDSADLGGIRYFLEDPAGGPWSGLYVIHFGDRPAVQEGDWVLAYGKIAEYYGLTELDLSNSAGGQQYVISSTNPLPAPVVLDTNDYATANPGTAEAYEGVLVEFQGAVVTDDDLGYGEWAFDDGSGATRADDMSSALAYTPANGDYYRYIRGLGYYGYNDYKIVPRYDADIELDYVVTFIYHDLEQVVPDGQTLHVAGNFNSWSTTATPMDGDGTQDIYTATLVLDAVPYDLQYKYIAGDSWDNGQGEILNTDNRQANIAASTTLRDYRKIRAGWAKLNGPSPIIVTVGNPTPVITGETWFSNIPFGTNQVLVAEMGYGTAADLDTWTWTQATFSGRVGNNDLFDGSLTPTASGVYSFAIRFDGNWGTGNPNSTWYPGDLDGVHPGDPFELANTGVLTVTAPDLIIDKTVTPKEDRDLGSVVTYTIVLANNGDADALGVVMTDALPVEVDFGGWVQQNGAIQANDTLTWTGNISVGVQLTFVFTATVGTDESFYGQSVINTAYFTSDNGGSGSDETGFTIVPEPYRLYLPIMFKNG